MSIEVMKQALEALLELHAEGARVGWHLHPKWEAQMRAASDSINALRTAIQQATQPAEVTDEQIAACVKRASTYGLPFVGLLNPGGTPSDFSKRFTAEILALRPVQVPMDKQDAWDNSPVNSDWEAVDAYLQGIEDAEAHHGITAQAKKEDE